MYNIFFSYNIMYQFKNSKVFSYDHISQIFVYTSSYNVEYTHCNKLWQLDYVTTSQI